MKMTSAARALDKIYKRRDRYEIPEWQRQEVWSRSKKQSLIDSILRDWKIPKFYFLKTSDDPEEFEVVDGQQRLVSIFEFFDNELPLSPASEELFGARYYRQLTDTLSDRFDDFEIEYDAIEEATDEEVKEFFQRLQQGLPLTGSEKLNSLHSNLRNFAADLTTHDFFKNKVTASDRRYGHFDIVAKAAAVEIDGIDVGLRFDDLKEVFESQSNFSSESNVANRLVATLDFLDEAFGEPNSYLRNRTVIQSLVTLAGRLVASGKTDGHESAFAAFFNIFMQELSHQVELGQFATDPDYLAFQRTVSANVRSGARTRLEIMLRKLLVHDPRFGALLTGADIADSALSAQIKRDAVEIARLVGQLNERYAAQHGEDLFKPTNKTVLAQHKLGTPIATLDDYKGLIDDLYFLFHEGVGMRLQGNVPDSFVDVNTLRTGANHDLNHGKPGKAKKKRQTYGDTFQKYSGFPSPETLDPLQFPVAQANLLIALKISLEQLSSATL
jgi:hypothetical protein